MHEIKCVSACYQPTQQKYRRKAMMFRGQEEYERQSDEKKTTNDKHSSSNGSSTNKHDEKQNLLNSDMDSGSQNTSGILDDSEYLLNLKSRCDSICSDESWLVLMGGFNPMFAGVPIKILTESVKEENVA